MCKWLRQVVKAARDPLRGSVVVFGEPGLEKSTIAALIHFGSHDRDKPMIQIEADRLDESASELVGRRVSLLCSTSSRRAGTTRLSLTGI